MTSFIAHTLLGALIIGGVVAILVFGRDVVRAVRMAVARRWRR